MRIPYPNKTVKDMIVESMIDRDYECGVCCRFVQINNKWGVKCYLRKRTMRRAMLRQQKAQRSGIAPRCGQAFTLRVKNHWCEYDTYYCFMTEVAKTYSGTDIDIDYPQRWTTAQRRLVKKLEELELHEITADLHGDNLGILRGKLVCIDFVGKS